MTTHGKGVRSETGLAVLGRVRKLVAGYPEVVEAVDKFGHTSFRVRDKPFVILGEVDEGPSLSIKADAYTQVHLIEHRGFVRTPYIGQHGWATLLRLPPDDWSEVEGLLRDAYLRTAPKSLSSAMDAASAEGSGGVTVGRCGPFLGRYRILAARALHQ